MELFATTLYFLKDVLVSSIGAIQKFRSRPSVDPVRYEESVNNEGWSFRKADREGPFGNFSFPVPFFHEFVLLDCHVGWIPTSHPPFLGTAWYDCAANGGVSPLYGKSPW